MKTMQAYQIAVAAAQGASVAGVLLPVARQWAATNALGHMASRNVAGRGEHGFIDPSAGSMGARMN